MKLIKGYSQWVNERLSEEATAAPVTGFKAADGLTYKTVFKTQADFDKFILTGNIPNGALLPPWVKVETAQQAATDRDNTREVVSQQAWKVECANIMQSIWLSMAFIGRSIKSIDETYPKATVINAINTASPQLTPVYNGGSSSGTQPIFLPRAKDSLETDKGWDKMIADPADKTGKTQITYWKYFVRTFLVPNVAAKLELVVAPTTAPK